MDNQLLKDRKVLVVEDEMLVLMGIEDLLSDLGCTSVAVAATVGSALDVIEQTKFDLAVLDVNLGGDRSYPVAKALAAKYVPFVFSTGYGEHGIDEGFGDYPVLTKPYTSSLFRDVLMRLLADRDELPMPSSVLKETSGEGLAPQ